MTHALVNLFENCGVTVREGWLSQMLRGKDRTHMRKGLCPIMGAFSCIGTNQAKLAKQLSEVMLATQLALCDTILIAEGNHQQM